MNRIFKVIFNRNRQLVQVVPEYARNRGKEVSESRKGEVRGLARVLLTFLATLMIASPGYAADDATGSTGSGNATYISDTNTDAQNIQALDKQVVQNAQDIAASKITTDTNKTDIATNKVDIATNKSNIETNKTAIAANKTAIDKNTSAIDANKTAIADNKTAIAKNTTDISTNKTTIAANTSSIATNTKNIDVNKTNIANNATAISKNETSIAANTANIATHTSDIANLKNLSNITDAGNTVIKEQAKQAVKVVAGDRVTVTPTGSETGDGTITYTVSANNNGTISIGDANLVSGKTMYEELRPASTGTYYYISSTNTTAQNLISLDTTLNKALAALDIDMTDSSAYTSKLSKYFKVNPKETTSDDGKTKTYAPDAAANGTNSVAVGPSAQAGEKSIDTSTGTSTTTITGGTSSAAIGDSAKANGNTSVALGYNSQVLNTTDQDGKTTATIDGSTAIGSGAKVNGASNATAVGTGAQVNETATGGIAFGKGAVTGEDKGTVTVGDATANVAAVGGENSVALGTSAKASGNSALSLGNGAQVNNYTTQSGTTVTKTVNSGSTAIGSGAIVTGANDAVAFGSGAKVEGTGNNADDSLAIGKGASVATAKDAMALGTSASVASGANNAIALGNTAKANTSNTTAIGYNASATGAGAVAIGENTSTSTEGGISIGSGTRVSGKSIAIGYSSDGVTTGSDNTDAVAIGNGAQAYANDSISIGHQAGKDTNEGRTSGYGSLIAIGTNAGGNVKGMQNVALGSGAGSNVKSSYNVAIGSNAGSGINYAAAADSNPQDGYNISIGYEANYQSADANAKNIKESIAIGHSANAVSEATALGTGTTASGDKSMALGYNATAVDTDSIALGDKASAAGGNIAIGSGSQAPAVASYDKGYLTGSTSVNGYISVGGKTSATGTTVLRRISNVADGAADQDAVTVAQLKQAYTNLEGTIKTTDNKISDTYTQSAIDSKISTVESKITASQTKYFSINPSSDTLTANVNNDGASTTGAADAMAIGPNATATSAKAVAIGNNVSASGKGSIALGTADNPATTGKVDAGNNTSANPHVTSAEGANSVAIGTSAIAQTDNSVALGTRASVYTSNVTDPATNTTVKVGQQSIAIGYEAETRNSNATSIGSDAKAYSNGSTAVGHNAYAQGADSVVIGTSSTAYGASSGIVGKSNTINGSNTYAVGSENNVTGNWGAVTYSGLYGSKNTVNPVADTSGNTKHGMDSLSITGNSNTISQGSYSDTVQNISILGNSNSVTGASSDAANAGTTANITVIGGNNEVTGRDGAGSDSMGKTWNQLTRTTVIGYGNKVNQATSTTSLADTQILGNDVTATLGNSVYLGTGAAAKNANVADATTLTDAEQAAVDALDTTGMTDTEKAAAQAKAKAAARYATNLKTMKQSGTTAGLQSLSTDTTYDDGTNYTYAGSSPAGVVTVGSVGSERRIQNVAAGLVSASSTDAVNGSQLYALTRQLRFGGDNSSFGTTTADDKNVVARGSTEALSIIGGETDSTKLTDNNIGVMADSTSNTLSVKLASDLKKLNTASLGSGSGDSYKETIKLDGANGKVTVADTSGTVKTTLDTTGLMITGGPKFTSSGIDAANQQIHNVTAGTADTDAANVGQVKSARTLLTQGTNTKLADTEANGHHTYTVNVDNLAVKANGTGTTVALANGINFKNGTNTTTAVDTDGTVTISATHNKLSTVSAAPTGTKDDVTLTLTDADGNTVTSTGLKNTYTTVTKDGTAHTVTFTRNDGTTQTLSLGDLDGASTGALATAAAKATSEVTNGTNVSSVTKSAGSNGQNIYTVNVNDLAVKTTSGEKKSVHLADGLVFADGTNTTATVGDNGTIKFSVSDAAIRKQAVQAITVESGSNVTVTPATNADGTFKTFTVAASDLKYSANGTSKTTSLANGISFAAGSNTTAEIDNNGAIKINATHNKLNATGAVTKATADNNAVTLTLQDADGNTTTAGLTDTYTTVSKDADNKKVTFKRNDGETQTLELSDLGGITAAQDKYVTSGTVTYDANGNGTAALTGNNGLTASITGLKDTKVSSGAATYVGKQGDASGSATLTMNDGTKATISGLKDDYITSAAVGTETNHVTMNRLGGGTVDLNLNPILEKYSLSDYRLVGNGDTQDKAYQVSADGTVTLNVVDAKNAANKKTIQITGLASQSGVNAGRTTVKSSDSSVIVNDGTSNSDTHTYDIKVDYSKIPANLTVTYSGDNGTAGSNTMDNATAFSGTANQIVTKAENGKVTFKLADDISGIQSVTTGDAKLDTDGLTVTGGPSVLKTGINAGGKTISNLSDAAQDTDAATLGQVKNARTKVAAGSNVAGVGSSEDAATHQMTYTVNVDNLSVKANDGTAKEVALKTGLNFKDGNNTTAVVGDDGEVKYDLNPALTGLISVTAGNSTLDTNGLTISGGPKFTKNGIDAGSQKITGVANGENANDAVNKGQLDALQNQVSGGWNLAGKNSDGTAVTAKIGAGKTVTYDNGNYTKSVVTKDDSTGNATVKVDVTTGTLTSGTDGKITAADGLATTRDVANAINNASWTIQDGNKPQNAQQVKAGDTVSFKAGDNLNLDQNGKVFTYKLNKMLTDMTSVTAVDDKQNKAVLNGEGLKVSDTEGNSLTQHATEIRLHDGTKAATDTATDVVLTKQGLQNGGHTITGVADGTIGEKSQDAINGSQFYKLQQTVANGGWNITGEDTTKSTHIGNDKTVSFKNGTNTTVAVNGSDTGVDVKVNVNTTAISTDGDHKATASGNGLATASDVASAINNAAWNVKKNGETAQQVKAGDTITFDAGDNIVLKQSGMSFTYGLASDVNINSIRLGGTKDGKGNWAGGIYVGEQAGSGANLAKGFYITGLSNTKWDRAAISENSSMAATEGQLKQAIENITKSGDGTGGFGLTADSGAPIMQDLRKTIQVKGDGEGTADGNIKTSNESGILRIRLNKKLDLTDQGSVTIGSSSLSNGRAQVGNVVVNGSDNTVSGLSNTNWDEATAKADGYKNSTKAATESQLQAVYDQATSTASANEQHIQAGTYGIQTTTDAKGNKQNSVTMDIVDGSGNNKGTVVINDVAKASDVGDTDKLAVDIKNQNGGQAQHTSVVEAVNNLNDKVNDRVGDNQYSAITSKDPVQDGDSSTTAIGKLNNRMKDIYNKATQHTSVSVDGNLTMDDTKQNTSGGTDYKIGLNKENIDLGKVTIKGNAGSISAQSMTADSFTAGDTAVNKDGIKIGDKSALTADDLKVNGKTYISSDGLNANSQKITHVQAGTADTDAANVGQVRVADEQLAGGIEQNARNINQLGRDVDKLDSRIDRVGAGAAALAALHPGAYDPNDKVDFSAGYGNYRGASAAAVGMYYHPDERTILSMGVAMGGGENMVNAGVTWKLGRRTPVVPQPVPVKASPAAPALVPVSTAAAAPVRPAETAPVVKPAVVQTAVRPVEAVAPAPVRMVQPVSALQPAAVKPADSNAQLMDLLARQTAILEKLAEQKAAPAAAPKVTGDDLFTDVPENHWAYAYALKLEQAGALKGLTGLQVAGNPLLSRNDFAKILYTALKNGATTNPALNQDGSLNRMASEFRTELKEVRG